MEEHHEENEERPSNHGSHPWMLGLVIVLIAAAGISLAYTFAQRSTLANLQAKNQNLASENQELGTNMSQMDATMNQLRNQVNTLNSKLATMSEPHPARRVDARRGVVRRTRPVVSPMRRLEARLQAQQSQLDQMKTEVAKQRTDIEGELGSTRDQLNGSIAKNHTELVALEKRGERNYYEFDLMKSKQFQRFGPVLLSLRKADTKHDHYNMMMLVDDKQLTKKNVNLYEPVWLYRADDPQPIQIVVNEIGKNYVHGYVSTAKYTKAELDAAEQQPTNTTAGQTPGSTAQSPTGTASTTQAPAQNATPQQPHHPQFLH